jgi:hypothetical protein
MFSFYQEEKLENGKNEKMGEWEGVPIKHVEYFTQTTDFVTWLYYFWNFGNNFFPQSNTNGRAKEIGNLIHKNKGKGYPMLA